MFRSLTQSRTPEKQRKEKTTLANNSKTGTSWTSIKFNAKDVVVGESMKEVNETNEVNVTSSK